jgi:hypothetical protein
MTLPELYSGAYCPFCGKGLPLTLEPQTNSARLKPVKINWRIFLLFLLVPPILTMITARIVHVPNESYSVVVGIVGGIAGGIACGIMLGLRIGRTPPTRVFLCILFIGIMTIASISLCCFGCSLGEYNLQLR